MVPLISNLIFNGFVSIVLKYISIFQMLSCTFTDYYRMVLICSMQKTLHYSFTCIPSWDCAIASLLSTGSAKANGTQRMEDNFLAKILKVRTVQYAYLTTCIFKMILQGQPEAPDSLDQDVPPPPDHDYRSCRAGTQPLRSQHRGTAPLTPVKSFMYSLECFHHNCVTWARETKVCSVIRLAHRTSKVWTPYVQYF